MGFATKESITINSKKYSATLIEGISVDSKYQGNGIMTVFMDSFVEELKAKFEMVLIQAYK
jgi:hypothetical protein